MRVRPIHIVPDVPGTRSSCSSPRVPRPGSALALSHWDASRCRAAEGCSGCGSGERHERTVKAALGK